MLYLISVSDSWHRDPKPLVVPQHSPSIYREGLPPQDHPPPPQPRSALWFKATSHLGSSPVVGPSEMPSQDSRAFCYRYFALVPSLLLAPLSLLPRPPSTVSLPRPTANSPRACAIWLWCQALLILQDISLPPFKLHISSSGKGFQIHWMDGADSLPSWAGLFCKWTPKP